MNPIVAFIKLIIAIPICFIGVLLPYRWRVRYTQWVAFAAHIPYLLFGRITTYLLKELSIEFESDAKE